MLNPLPIEKLASLPKIILPKVSHAGDKVAFYWDKTGRFELYVMDLISREIQQITNGEAPKGIRTGFVWTRDDQNIIFGKDNDGDEQNNLYHLNIATGAIKQLTTAQSQEHAYEVHPDNSHLSVISNKNGQMNIYRYNFADDSFNQLTHFAAPVFAGRWSKNGTWLAFWTNESDNLKNSDGYIMKADGSEIQKRFSCQEGARDKIVDWHPDGVQVAVSSDYQGNERAGIFNLETEEVRWFGQAGRTEYVIGFSQDGRWLACSRNENSAFMPVLYDTATGEAHEFNLPAGLATNIQFALNDRKLLLRHTTANRCHELLMYDLEADSYEVLLEADYGDLDPERFVADEHIWYESFDGQNVPALLHKPHEVSSEKPCPAVVMVHGGAASQFFRSFNIKVQFLASCGYVILAPNFRGSTGYGTVWCDAHIKDWGGGDLEDVAAGINYLKELPYVDSERIAVMGGSFGGFMTFLLSVKKPNLFKLAVPVVGISDLHLLYEDAMDHFKYIFKRQMGDPQENYALWRDRSAIEFADKLQAKMLMMHGTNDPRCPVNQSRIFRDRLLELGKTQGTAEHDDFEYHEFEDEGHGASGNIQGTIRSLNIIADFFERRL